MSDSFEAGSTPAIRNAHSRENSRHLRDYPCPFCGKNSMLNSIYDVPEDQFRVQVYCDNPECEVREMEILAMRTNGLTDGRADIKALNTVDGGTREEQEANGAVFTDHEDGSTTRVTTLKSWDESGGSEGNRARKLEYRTRDAVIEVRPT